jgi:hypothetical protein
MRWRLPPLLLPLLALAGGCTGADSYGSGWSMGIGVRDGEERRALEQTMALVDSLVREGYRLVETRRDSVDDGGRIWISRGWTLQGRHPDIGRHRVVIDATTDSAATHNVAFSVRFRSPEGQNPARDAFEPRLLAIAEARR